MDVLKDAGLNFELHKTNGIDPMVFAESFLVSDLVFNDDLTWI